MPTVVLLFSRSVVPDSLRPHELQHARPPCPSPTPGVHSNSVSIELVMPSSQLVHCRPLHLLPPIPPSIRVFLMSSVVTHSCGFLFHNWTCVQSCHSVSLGENNSSMAMGNTVEMHSRAAQELWLVTLSTACQAFRCW